MNKDIAMKWVEALRSGKYLQGKSYLEYKGAYCCLGVLCEINSIPIEDSQRVLSINTINKFNMLSVNGDLPGIDPIGTRSYAYLTGANDGGESFAAIADYIELNWENL